jgi:PAS domain S-box-containing protein
MSEHEEDNAVTVFDRELLAAYVLGPLDHSRSSSRGCSTPESPEPYGSEVGFFFDDGAGGETADGGAGPVGVDWLLKAPLANGGQWKRARTVAYSYSGAAHSATSSIDRSGHDAGPAAHEHDQGPRQPFDASWGARRLAPYRGGVVRTFAPPHENSAAPGGTFVRTSELLPLACDAGLLAAAERAALHPPPAASEPHRLWKAATAAAARRDSYPASGSWGSSSSCSSSPVGGAASGGGGEVDLPGGVSFDEAAADALPASAVDSLTAGRVLLHKPLPPHAAPAHAAPRPAGDSAGAAASAAGSSGSGGVPVLSLPKPSVTERAAALAAAQPSRRDFFVSALKQQLGALRRENERLKALAARELPDAQAALLLAACIDKQPCILTDAAFQPTARAAAAAEHSSSYGGGSGKGESSGSNSSGAAAAGPAATLYGKGDTILLTVLRDSQRSYVITDPRQLDNPIVWVSPSFCSLTGYARDEILGRNCRFLQGPATDQAVVGKIRKALNGKYPDSMCLVNYRRDGTPFWNNLFISPLFDAQGAVVHYIGVQCDVTAAYVPHRSLRQEAAQEARARDGNGAPPAVSQHQQVLIPVAWMGAMATGPAAR